MGRGQILKVVWDVKDYITFVGELKVVFIKKSISYTWGKLVWEALPYFQSKYYDASFAISVF